MKAKLNNKEIIIMLQIKSLLNYLDYIIRDEHKKIVSAYHKLCRKYCKNE